MRRFLHWLCGRTPFYPHDLVLLLGRVEWDEATALEELERVTKLVRDGGPAMNVYRCVRCGEVFRVPCWVHVS